MITQKTWTDLLDKPQGNESVDGHHIVREYDLHQFRILWSFDNNKNAEVNFKQWLLENQE